MPYLVINHVTFVLIMVRPLAKNKDTVPNFIGIQKNFHYFRLSKAWVAHFFVNMSMPIKILDSVILGSSNKISNLLRIFNSCNFKPNNNKGSLKIQN